jgi:hypothetical protein
MARLVTILRRSVHFPRLFLALRKWSIRSPICLTNLCDVILCIILSPATIFVSSIQSHFTCKRIKLHAIDIGDCRILGCRHWNGYRVRHRLVSLRSSRNPLQIFFFPLWGAVTTMLHTPLCRSRLANSVLSVGCKLHASIQQPLQHLKDVSAYAPNIDSSLESKRPLSTHLQLGRPGHAIRVRSIQVEHNVA